jgi:ferredoxin
VCPEAFGNVAEPTTLRKDTAEDGTMPYVIGDECILCGACVAGCPVDAIEEGETKCRIDPDICIECGTCEQNCPSGAIIFVEPEEPELPG